jgi:toxin FitB
MWLVDTNVVSELAKPKPDQKTVTFLAREPLLALFTSSVTLGEIRYGVSCIPDVLKRERRTYWLEHTIRPLFAGRVLEITEEVVFRWRVMLERGKAQGLTFAQPDLFIAATASVHSLIVVTRNLRDFQPCGVPVFNPWTGERFNGA